MIPPEVKVALRVLLNHVEPDWENCKAVVQEWLERQETPPESGLPREFYNQRIWLEIHSGADELIATKNGAILAALYKSPRERHREDFVAFVKMLQDWANEQKL